MGFHAHAYVPFVRLEGLARRTFTQQQESGFTDRRDLDWLHSTSISTFCLSPDVENLMNRPQSSNAHCIRGGKLKPKTIGNRKRDCA